MCHHVRPVKILLMQEYETLYISASLRVVRSFRSANCLISITSCVVSLALPLSSPTLSNLKLRIKPSANAAFMFSRRVVQYKLVMRLLCLLLSLCPTSGRFCGLGMNAWATNRCTSIIFFFSDPGVLYFPPANKYPEL